MAVLRLGFVPTAGTHLVPRLIREYRAFNPAVAFSLRNVLTADQGRMLEEGSLDLGFLWMPFASGPSLDVVLIHHEPLCWLYLRPTHWPKSRQFVWAKP
jgi:DNA-binding transcriptional LysR family regulator